MKLKIQIWLLIATFIASLLSSSEFKVHFFNADVFQFQIKTSIQSDPFLLIEETTENDLSIKKKVKQFGGRAHIETSAFVCKVFCSHSFSVEKTIRNVVAFDTSPPCFRAK
jgi:hypothetical protein